MTNEAVDDEDDNVNEAEEDISSGSEITHPFDPNKIRVRTWTPTVYNLMEKLKHAELDLAPEFQRRGGIWDYKRQSQLIESILIRIPLPAFYLDEIQPSAGDSVGERYAVVDGVQRLTVLSQYINNNAFALSGLEFLNKLQGKKFDELDPHHQRRILETQLAVNIVEPGTPDAAKLNIFKRINTGGMALTAQEIRHAMNPGPVRAWLQRVSQLPSFRAALGESASTRMALRMADRECVTRFVAFVDSGVPDYRKSQKDFDGYLHEVMGRISKMSEAERQVLESRFDRAMKAAKECLGGTAFRKVGPTGRKGPVNKAVFEATAVSLDKLSPEDLARVIHRGDSVKKKIADVLSQPDVAVAVTEGTGDPRRVERRFDAFERAIREAL